MVWYHFVLPWIPIIGYLLIGRGLGTASRAAWIMAQTFRVQEVVDTRFEGKLPWSFYMFFPYTAATRRLHPCGAEFLVDRDKGLNRITDDDLFYVRIHYLFWPVRVAIILITGTMAICYLMRSATDMEKRIAKLQKRRLTIRERIKRLHLDLYSVDQQLEELAKQNQSKMERLAKEVAADCEYMPLERGRAPVRPTLVVKIKPCEDKTHLN